MPKLDPSEVARYADEIMQMVDEDIARPARNHRGEPMPATVSSFSELHDYVDANEYLMQAEVPWSVDDVDACNQVSDEVTRRLAERTRRD